MRHDSTSPIGTHSEFTFEIPTPGGPVHFSVRPSLDHCQFTAVDDNEFLSAHVQCTRLVINDEPEEECAQCLVLQGKAGHACVTPGTRFHSPLLQKRLHRNHPIFINHNRDRATVVRAKDRAIADEGFEALLFSG